MPAEAVTDTLRHAVHSLRQLDVPLALMGGLALAAWDRVRSTQDVDLLISVRGIRTPALLSKLASAGFRAKGKQAIIRLEDAEFIQLLYEPPGSFMSIQVDMLLAEDAFLEQALANSVPLPRLEFDFELAVLRCEDLILLKLLAGRILDRVDAAELIKANRDSLDIAHLKGWLQHFRLERAFAEAWSDAFPGDATPF